MRCSLTKSEDMYVAVCCSNIDPTVRHNRDDELCQSADGVSGSLIAIP
jgi:hypothetical protein